MPPSPKFTIRRAHRDIQNVLIGLVAAPGGGKTCTALRLARGIAPTGRIIMVSTERGKSTEYAPHEGDPVPAEFDPASPTFDVDVIEMGPPFSPARFEAAVRAAAAERPSVLIIDNITDEMHGEGGQLDLKENAPDSDKFGWIEPKRQHRGLMNELRSRPWYVIMTIRAKEKIRPASAREKRQGLTGVINEGWLPQCDGGLHYDCTILALLDQGVIQGRATPPWKLPPALADLANGQPLDEAAGRAIAHWAQPKGQWAPDDERSHTTTEEDA